MVDRDEKVEASGVVRDINLPEPTLPQRRPRGVEGILRAYVGLT
jgi:hypothetical protein